MFIRTISSNFNDIYEVNTDRYQIISVGNCWEDSSPNIGWRTRIFLNKGGGWDVSLLADTYGNTRRKSIHNAVIQARNDSVRKQKLWIKVDKIEEYKRINEANVPD